MSGLAARLGLRRPSGAPAQPPVRTVTAEPPAPVYSGYRPLPAGGTLVTVPSPRYPDPLVFGPADGGPVMRGLVDGPFRRCGPCDVTWHGEAACWNCGRAETPWAIEI